MNYLDAAELGSAASHHLRQVSRDFVSDCQRFSSDWHSGLLDEPLGAVEALFP